MTDSKTTVIDQLELPQGLEIDLDEGWLKLINRQFGGEAGRGFSELIQNFLDSYPSYTAWDERFGEIETDGNCISITDYGEGMDRKRLKMIATLGGTDKSGDNSKIGSFGIGFFSIFNRKLGTQKVTVTTKCEGHYVELVFTVIDSEKRPVISTRRLKEKLPFSTKIGVEFDNAAATENCLKHAVKSLKYYPCLMLINKKPCISVWEQAKQDSAYFFTEDKCDGFLEPASWGSYVTLLCKYEYIMQMRTAYLVTGGYDMTNDLRDFHRREVPFVPALATTINSNNLRVTISRDSFYLDYNYEAMIRVLARALMDHLGRILAVDFNADLVIANQYILRKQLRGYLKNMSEVYGRRSNTVDSSVLGLLAEAKVYRLNGRSDLFSLKDMYNMRSKDTPLFFSPRQSNLRWLGGQFRHDFIVLPKECRSGGGAPVFYDDLFSEVFQDTVNLDLIKYDYEKIAKLVERGIVDKKTLNPNCRIIGTRKLTGPEHNILEEIDTLLSHPEVRDTLARHLHLRVKCIRSVFFEVDRQGATLASGLFNESGDVLDGNTPDNVRSDLDEGEMIKLRAREERDILLGLRRDHPFVQHMVESDDSHKAYYALTYLAHEISLCQKLLVPDTPLYHSVKERLAAAMRTALISQITRGNEQVA